MTFVFFIQSTFEFYWKPFKWHNQVSWLPFFQNYNFTVMRAFNDCNGDTCMEQFCETYKPKKLIKKTTRIKNIDNASSTDLILRNHYECFQGSEFFETGSSDLHNLTYLVKKSCFQCRYNVKYRCQIIWETYSIIIFKHDIYPNCFHLWLCHCRRGRVSSARL